MSPVCVREVSSTADQAEPRGHRATYDGACSSGTRPTDFFLASWQGPCPLRIVFCWEQEARVALFHSGLALSPLTSLGYAPYVIRQTPRGCELWSGPAGRRPHLLSSFGVTGNNSAVFSVVSFGCFSDNHTVPGLQLGREGLTRPIPSSWRVSKGRKYWATACKGALWLGRETCCSWAASRKPQRRTGDGSATRLRRPTAQWRS